MKRLTIGQFATNWLIRDRDAVIGLFNRVFSLSMLIVLARLGPNGNEIWGADAFVIRDFGISGFNELAVIFTDAALAPYWWVVYSVCMLFLALNVLGWTSLVGNILLWVAFVNLHYQNPEISNGGFHLAQQVFFWMIFLNLGLGKPKEIQDGFRPIRNLALFAIQFQIALLYLTAGLSKIQGELWLSGDALSVVLQIPSYGFNNFWEVTNWGRQLLPIGTWGVLIYQLIFAVVIWFKQLKYLMLWIGVIFHLTIAFWIGIFDFGIIMVAAYSIFATNNQLKTFSFFRSGFSQSHLRGES